MRLFLFLALLPIIALMVLAFTISPGDNGERIHVAEFNDTLSRVFVEDQQVYAQRWDTLPQIEFWRIMMNLSADTGILNVANSRKILGKYPVENWGDLTDAKKESIRDSLKWVYCLEDDTRIFFTSGKKDFYHFQKVIPAIDKGVELFNTFEVDPWFAQAILLIESPGRLEKSPVGAYGSFQLMSSVARKFGLKVNRIVDERKDFDRSAYAASQLLKTVCIPETQAMLDKREICYEESDLWFRLLVLHVYHAGAYNVGKVLDKLSPEEGGQDLIRLLWKTEYGRFRNASQNYSQVALASFLEFNSLIYDNCLETCGAMEVAVLAK